MGRLVGVRCGMWRAASFLCALTMGAAAAWAQTVDVPAGQKVVLTAEGRGSQIYRCNQAEKGAQWVFVAPEAQLFVNDVLVGTHGAGPMWSYGGGNVHGRMVKTVPSPDAGAVPWLLVQATTTDGSGVLTSVTYVQRTATKGGAMPAEGCDAGHVGVVSRVPYTATYTFYAAAQ